MQNNQVGNIALGSGVHKKARFNLSHDVNSTYQFGEVQPVLFRDMISGEKDVVDIESMVRLAPMVAPTFGRIQHKEWHHFIPFTDLFPHYGQFLSETSFGGQFADKLPSMSLCFLSYMCLIGSKMTIYNSPDPEGTTNTYSLLRSPAVGQGTTSIDNLLNMILSSQGLSSPSLPFGFQNNYSSSTWNVSSSYVVNLRYLLNPNLLYYIYNNQSYSYRQNMNIPVANWDTYDWFDFEDKTIPSTGFSFITDLDSVSLDAADAVIPYTVTYNGSSRDILLAFRFSNFGKRLYKILTGLGYCLDFESTTHLSLMPLFAFYKAWFDNFGITRNMSWTDTGCYNLLRKYDFAPSSWDFNSAFSQSVGNSISWSDWIRFIVELGNCWVTEDIDFVSAHTTDLPQNSAGNSLGDALTSIVPDPEKTLTDIVHVSKNVPNTPNQMQYPAIEIKSSGDSILSALEIKQLMQVYRWSNRQSVAGKSAENILRAQGYGYFLYSCKSNFIGYTEQSVQVYDVVSSSDTFNSSSNDGALLGQYAGRGLGYDKSKTLVFEASEDGMWIGLCAIVPKSGYSQALNPVLLANSKFMRYNPDLDGKYMVLSPKSTIRGNKPFSSFSYFDSLKDAFGFIPIYSGLKIANNVANGGFSLRSQRKVFEPYMLDKILDVGERNVYLKTSTSSLLTFYVSKYFEDLPGSGNFWRYLGRYPWMGNLDRIFAKVVSNGELLNDSVQSITPSDSSFEYSIVSDDNFMVHHVVNQIAFSPMLPIEESFQTEDEDGNFDSSVKMA